MYIYIFHMNILTVDQNIQNTKLIQIYNQNFKTLNLGDWDGQFWSIHQ